MRTTIRLNDHLLAQAKKLAVSRGTTLTAVIEDSVRQFLARQEAPQPRSHFRFPTFKGNGIRLGIDLDDNAALLELIDEHHGID